MIISYVFNYRLKIKFHALHNLKFKGPEVQNFDQLYLKKDNYFDKQYRIKDS